MGNIVVSPKDEEAYDRFCFVMNNGMQPYTEKDMLAKKAIIEAAGNGQLEAIKHINEANEKAGNKTVHELVEEAKARKEAEANKENGEDANE
jgi:hypothetical protein